MENKKLNRAHVMIDTETLGLTPGCVIRSVSLVEFNPFTGEIGRKKTWIINLQDSIKAGFHIETGTLKWWLLRPEDARKAFVSTPEEEISLISFVNEFTAWFEPYNGKVVLWGLQLDFDTSVIRSYLGFYYLNIMRADNYAVPWNREYMIEARPFVRIFRKMNPEKETLHQSMADCLMQIEAVAFVFQQRKEICLANEILDENETMQCHADK